jgi:hypothetical protein
MISSTLYYQLHGNNSRAIGHAAKEEVVYEVPEMLLALWADSESGVIYEGTNTCGSIGVDW